MRTSVNYSGSVDADTGEAAGVLCQVGLRPTAQRRIVLVSLLHCSSALTAQELHGRLRDGGRPVGLSTIYRTLWALADAGALHTFARMNEVAFRRCADGPHEHLICLRCGRIDDVPPAGPAPPGSSRADTAGFTVQSRRTDVYGICASCLCHQA
ncbi:Fur family transcriptional regulator [Sediminivirga luteola]|uniref:Fur family transcriptional regulator n=1 Tax=Sediminivirga luteola TaxID=1774748 RepID=UPI003BB76D89